MDKRTNDRLDLGEYAAHTGSVEGMFKLAEPARRRPEPGFGRRRTVMHVMNRTRRAALTLRPNARDAPSAQRAFHDLLNVTNY